MKQLEQQHKRVDRLRPAALHTQGGVEQQRPKSLSTRVFVAWLAALTLLVLGLSLAAGSEVRLIGLLIFLPAIAASLGTVRQTQVASLWALAAVTASIARSPGYHLDDGITLALTLVFAGLAIYGSRWRIARDTELLRLRSTAAVVQQHILHPLPELTSQVRVDGIFEPVQEDKLFGGDIYDVAATRYGTRVLIGDVQGKGLSAVGVAFAVLGGFREAAHREPRPAGLVDALEMSVVRHNAYARHSGEPERFVTALVVCVDPVGQGTAQAVNCGHLPPFLVRDSCAPVQVELRDTGVPLGLASLVREGRVADGFSFPPDSTLLLYTDGLSEARDGNGSFYPLAERLAALVEESRAAGSTPSETEEGQNRDGKGEAAGRPEGSALGLAQALREDVRAYTHPHQQDDLAILTLERLSAPAAESAGDGRE
ncbi:PP2C family protein-serine/threonine phosphatase [Streptomyces reniochalinae]|uniref:Serine/threonine-protein phosphatase n=1 Tax=Streptomyces reniochalinae TaxID=2250578 RepID=A0A367EB58_9ACTN|nr:PP2C family protein-serine/threonine phosphatase [Streptomyces reniochalinae]RCG15296.1 serine/threonine-protein phosphatase [Streptomyces reniochalinae]